MSAFARAYPPAEAVPTIRRSAREPLLAGRYQILKQLGAGASSIVFAAFDRHLRRGIALKLLCPGYGLEALREARAMGLVSHPNVLKVYDAGTIRQAAFLTMELIRGTTLREWAKTPRSARDVVWAMTYAGRGLAAAHYAGVVHRDFKPANVLVDRRGAVKVGDFGIAARAKGEGDGDGLGRERLPTIGGPMGTEPYMAPEVAHGIAADARSDQFSFCASLFELLAGEHLFPTGTAASYAPETVPLRLRQIKRRGVGRALLRVMARGLSYDPGARYPTMGHLLSDLEGTLHPRLPPHMPVADLWAGR